MLRAFNPITAIEARGVAISLVLLDTGIRSTEFCRITMCELNPETGHAQIHGKGSRDLTVEMGRRALRSVRRYASRHPPEPIPASADRLFLTRSGRPLNRNTLHRVFGRQGDS